MSAPDAIHQLVKRFEEHRDSYQSSRYNETQLHDEIASIDRAIDRLGYELYGLTEDEVKVVEG